MGGILSGAMSGASMGSSTGSPWGTLIGAGLGAANGAMSGGGGGGGPTIGGQGGIPAPQDLSSMQPPASFAPPPVPSMMGNSPRPPQAVQDLLLQRLLQG